MKFYCCCYSMLFINLFFSYKDFEFSKLIQMNDLLMPRQVVTYTKWPYWIVSTTTVKLLLLFKLNTDLLGLVPSSRLLRSQYTNHFISLGLILIVVVGKLQAILNWILHSNYEVRVLSFCCLCQLISVNSCLGFCLSLSIQVYCSMDELKQYSYINQDEDNNLSKSLYSWQRSRQKLIGTV